MEILAGGLDQSKKKVLEDIDTAARGLPFLNRSRDVT